MLNRLHLEILREVQREGSLSRAAEKLFLTQSALSHSIKKLEKDLNVSIWYRQGRKLRLTQAGELLQDLASRVLPDIEHSEEILMEIASGKRGILRIGMECHPCYRWLQSIITPFLNEWRNVDVDIKQQFQFDGLTALSNHDLDMLVTPDPEHVYGVTFVPAFDYELVLVISKEHHLAGKEYLVPKDLRSEVLFTYPVIKERLDIFNYFLNPARIRPRQQKPLESTEIMLQMVAAGRGVTALPRWLLDQYPEIKPIVTRSLGKRGVFKKIYLGIHDKNLEIDYIKRFIEIARQNSPRLVT